MNGTLWALLVFVGFGLMWTMRHTKAALLDAVFVRVAAFSFAGAGVIGASGWIGTALAWTVTTANDLGATLGAATLGTTAVWMVWLALSLMWVLTLLPAQVFTKEIPDWLAVAGLVLPGLAASIPGEIGELLRQVIEACGQLMVDVVAGVFGMST